MLDIPALRQLCEAATKGPWHLATHAIYAECTPRGRTAIVAVSQSNRPNALSDAAFIAAAREALPAALDEIESLRAELAAAREKKPVAWAIFNDRMSWPVVGCDEAEIRGKATMTGDRVVPLIIPPGAGG